MGESEYTNYSMQYSRKGYGRFFVEKEEDIEKIKQIIQELDEYEFEYLPENLITVFDPENYESVYTHKFCDLDMGRVLKVAWERGIHCFAVFGKINQYDE